MSTHLCAGRQWASAIFIVLCYQLLLPSRALAVPVAQIAFGETGLTAIEYQGTNYLKLSQCIVNSIKFDSSSEIPSLTVLYTSIDAAQMSMTRGYSWGAIKCAYSTIGAQLFATVSITNDAAYNIVSITISLFDLIAPSTAATIGGSLTETKANLEGPEIKTLIYGPNRILIACEQPRQMAPIVLQTADPAGDVNVSLSTSMSYVLPAQTLTAVGHDSVSSSGTRYLTASNTVLSRTTDTYVLSFSFSGSDNSLSSMMSNLFDATRITFPPNPESWADRRPIAAVFLASHAAASVTPYNPLNPRYWVDANPSVDISSPAGLNYFQTHLLDHARRAVSTMQEVKAQGAVVWDVEGQEFKQPVSYVGDPRYLSPEMETIVDRFFATLTAAKLRCGVTIRPSTFSIDASGAASQVFPATDSEALANLDAKIRYAQSRWGCTMFYIDSDGDTNWPIDYTIFQELALAHPDVLLIPENKTLADFSWTAPYIDARLLSPSVYPIFSAIAPDEVLQSYWARQIYADAFSVIALSDVNMSALSETGVLWHQLFDAVKAGDILMIDDWPSPQNKVVSAIYAAAAVSAPSAPRISGIPDAIAAGSSFRITGSGFTPGSVVNFFVSTSTGPLNEGPLIPGSATSTLLTVEVPAGVALGQGFVAVQVVNTDMGYAASNLAYALLQGSAAAGLPTIESVNGFPLAPSSRDPNFAADNVETSVTPGDSVTLGGTGFDTVDGVAVDLFCVCPGGKVGPFFLNPGNPGLSPTSLTFTIPAIGPQAPTIGPGAFVVSNAGPSHSYTAKSNAVAVPIGPEISVSSVTQSSTIITVNGTGFSARTVINFFNAQSSGVVNLGGIGAAGVPKIALTLISANQLSFSRPFGAVPGPSYVQAMNPPFVPFTSSGIDPGGAFMLK